MIARVSTSGGYRVWLTLASSGDLPWERRSPECWRSSSTLLLKRSQSGSPRTWHWSKNARMRNLMSRSCRHRIGSSANPLTGRPRTVRPACPPFSGMQRHREAVSSSDMSVSAKTAGSLSRGSTDCTRPDISGTDAAPTVISRCSGAAVTRYGMLQRCCCGVECDE